MQVLPHPFPLYSAVRMNAPRLYHQKFYSDLDCDLGLPFLAFFSLRLCSLDFCDFSFFGLCVFSSAASTVVSPLLPAFFVSLPLPSASLLTAPFWAFGLVAFFSYFITSVMQLVCAEYSCLLANVL